MPPLKSNGREPLAPAPEDEGTQIASENTRAALERELKARAEEGAGLAELLDHLKTTNRRLGPLRKLSDEQFDELSLYCWTLQRINPTGLLWGQARQLWGGSRITARGTTASRRRPRASDRRAG